MKTLDRYLLRRMTVTLVRALFALVAIYVLIDLLTHRDIDILKYDVPAGVVARYYIAFIPQILFRIAPFAVLITGLLVLGDAAQNNEITAVLAGGISLRRLVITPLMVCLVFAVALFAFNETVGAAAAREANRIDEGYFSKNPEIQRKGISWANLSEKWTCHIGKFNRIALTGEDVLMHADDGSVFEQIESRRIYWDESVNQWILEDGRWYTILDDVTAAPGVRIRQQPAPFEESPRDLFSIEQPMETKTSEELMQEILSARKRAISAVTVSSLWVDYHAKFSQPALSFVMIWLAIPFALRVRRGGLGISFGISIVIAITYLLVFAITTSLGHAGRLSPPVAAWLANALFFAVGAFLFWRTPT
jgi:lipopolysaccharide export system permease protein